MHILFLHRTPIEGLPPAQNQVGILLERGHSVSVLQEYPMDSRHGAGLLPTAVARHYVHGTELSNSSFAGRVARFVRFHSQTRKLLREINPDIVVTGDAEAAAAVGNLPRRLGCMLFWHFHELPERQTSGTQHWANRYVWQHAIVPHGIVFPDLGRAEIFAQDARIPAQSIMVVPNCPRLLRDMPKPSLREYLGDRLPPDSQAVLYHGAVGKSHGLETAIRSFPKWPPRARLVLKGPVAQSYVAVLKGLAQAAGGDDRLLIVDPGWQSVDEHFAFIAGADIGWTALEPTRPCWRHAAFASNKRFECMALGIPQVTDNNPRVPELVEKTGCGICVDPASSEAAAAAICRLLDKPSLREEMGAKARQQHLVFYHYERQYQPLLNYLEASVLARRQHWDQELCAAL